MTEPTPPSQGDINASSHQEIDGVNTSVEDMVGNVGKDFNKTVKNEIYISNYSIAERQRDEIAPKEKSLPDIDRLVQDVRDRMGDYVRRCCGTMRVLDMTQPIELGDIYTNVNILEKLTCRQWLGTDIN
ncbi:MAG: hypothetical protein GDA43_17360 [Hormoscilla sp. SP5CHS1]|nr:hypothetical protein [Hormoscilla sp. SP5CHS1]